MYYERLSRYQKTSAVINGHEFVFIVEATRSGAAHACSVEDIKRLLTLIPAEDYGKLKLIVLRQPKRKEEVLSGVWGRLIYSYELEGRFYPAVVLEAVNYSRALKWAKSLSVDDQQELARLRADGHAFRETGNSFVAELEPEAVRNTQLYRTLLHEFGHYVHYCRVVDHPGCADEDYETRERRWEAYHKLPWAEKESFAHRYADDLRWKLFQQRLLPFARL